jgi:hypothetical protein
MIWLKGVWLAVVIYTSLPRRKARAKDTPNTSHTPHNPGEQNKREQKGWLAVVALSKLST